MSIESGEFHPNEEHKEILSEKDKKFIAYCIEDLRAPTQKILEQLHNKIERGEYTIIIGDDTSGRIPTVIIGGVIKELYNKKNLPSPLVRFIAGGSFSHKGIVSKFNEYAEKLRGEGEEQFGSNRAQKVLIVTEFMGTGRTLEPLIMNFKAKGMPCDVAAVGFGKNIFQRFRFEKVLGGEIIWGQKNEPKVWKKKEITGVKKDYKHLFSESFRDEKNQPVINGARGNARKLTSELVTWYNEKYK